jgi:hypothetical protein
MKIKTLPHMWFKFGTILSVILALAASLFLIGSAYAASPPYINWTEFPSNPVLDPVEKAYYPSVLFDGTIYRMWYDNGTTTHYTTSVDGITWAPWTPMVGLNAIADHPHVEKIGSKYVIWYWDNSVSIYGINAIRTAESTDGINWTGDQAVTQIGLSVVTGNAGVDWNAGSYGVSDVFYNAGGSATIVSPVNSAAVWQNKFVMYYDGTDGGKEDIGLAVSADGKLWQGYNGGAASILAHGGGVTWDSNYATFGTVLKIGGTYYLWYSGGRIESNEGIGYATSTDGLVWTKDAGNPVMHYTDGVPWRSVRTYTPMVIYDASQFSGAGEAVYFKMWFTGKDVPGNYAVGYASIAEVAPGPATVGGTVNPVDKITILMPYIAAAAATGFIVIGGVMARKRFIRVNNRK